jgi:hypothetical protein
MHRERATIVTCACSCSSTGNSPILNVFNGQVYGNEIMPSLAHATMLADGTLANPYFETFPTAAKYEKPGYQPIMTRSALTDQGKLQFGLVLDSEYTQACPTTCGDITSSRRRRQLRFGSYTQDECAACPP